MPNNEEHSQESIRRYGKSFSELHKWMDEPSVILGANHRKYRHDPNTTPKEARALFGENADNACLDHIRLDELERRKKGIQSGLFKEPSLIRLTEKQVVATYPIEKPQGWVRTDKEISWEQIIKRCPKCNAIFSSAHRTNCPFCGQEL
jgi:hypothetical protein